MRFLFDSSLILHDLTRFNTHVPRHRGTGTVIPRHFVNATALVRSSRTVPIVYKPRLPSCMCCLATWQAMQQRYRRSRSVSEPAVRLQCSSVSRERRRESEIEYETGRDRATLSLSQWSSEEVYTRYLQYHIIETMSLYMQVSTVLYHLVCRCNQPQLKILYTVCVYNTLLLSHFINHTLCRA